VDWANVVEEIESVGRSELRACVSLLLQALIHMLKAEVRIPLIVISHSGRS
jgi:Domain of unknown function DUF29